MATEDVKEYRALFGMNYMSLSDNEVRVEEGDKIDNMPEDEARRQERMGNIEEWVDRQTENVGGHSEEEPAVTGVESRHANQGEDIVLKGVNENA